MSTTDDTHATRRGSESNDLLGQLPEGYTAASEMCRLLDLSARQASEIERLRAALLLMRGRLLMENPRAVTTEADELLLRPNAKLTGPRRPMENDR